MGKNELKKIVEIFDKYQVSWYINIVETNSKTLEYSPLHDDLSLDSTTSIHTWITVIKDHKKSSFSMDWYSLEKIENSIKDISKVIDYSEYDENIVLPNITDSVEKDFCVKSLENIWFDYLEKEFLKFKNYDFDKKIIIEWFSSWVEETSHYYINSLWVIKKQKDNSSFYYMDLFAQDWENRETEYEYKKLIWLPEIKEEDIKDLQNNLLNKLNSSLDYTPWIYDITLDRDVVIEFLDIVLSSLRAESIREQMSLFSKNNFGDKIFSSDFTLVKESFLEWYTWNVLFDSEWITVQKQVFFESWVFLDKIYDYKNALREWLSPKWSLANIVLDWKIDKNYLKWSKFLFKNLMAFHTVDTITWKFSLSWEWYMLDENWNKKEYVKNISLSWDIINLFNSIKSIWDDFKKDWSYKVSSITFANQKIV